MVMSDQGKCLIDIIDDPNALEEFFAKKGGSQPSEQGGTLTALMVGSKAGGTMSASHSSATVAPSRSTTELPTTVQQLLLPSVVSNIGESTHSGTAGVLALQTGAGTPAVVKALPNIQPKTVVSSVQPAGAILQTSAPLLASGAANVPGKSAAVQPVNIVNIMPKQATQQQHQTLQPHQQQLQQLQSQSPTVQQTPVQIGGGNFILAPQGMHQFMINGQPVRLHVLQAAGGSGGFIIPYAAAGQQQPTFSIVPGMSNPQQQPVQQLQQQQLQQQQLQQQQLQQQLQQLQFVGQASQLRSMGQPINVMAVANQANNGAQGTTNMIALPPNIIQLQLPSAAAVSGTAAGQAPAYICSPLTSRSGATASVAQRMAVSSLPNLAPATSVAQQGNFTLSNVYGGSIVALSKPSNDPVSGTASNVASSTVSMQSSTAQMSSTANQPASAEGWAQAQGGGGASSQTVQLLRDQQTQALYEQALKLQREQLAAAVVCTVSMSTASTVGQPVLTMGNAGVKLTTASASGSKPTAAVPATSVAQVMSQPSQQLQAQQMLLPIAPGVVAVPTQAQQMLVKIQSHINLLRNLPTTSEEQNTTLQQLQGMQQQIIAQVMQKQQQPQQLQLQSLRPTQASVAMQQAAVTASAVQAQGVPTQMVYIAGGPPQTPAVADGHAGNIPSLIAALRTVKIGLQTYTVQLTDEQLRSFADQLAKMTPEQQKEFVKRQQAQLVVAALNRQRLAAAADGSAGAATTSQSAAQLPLPVASVSAAQVPSAPVDRLAARLRQDQAAVLKPDTKAPFASLDDACRRLLRYHVYQHRSPSHDDYCRENNAFEMMSRGLLQRKCVLVDKFRELLWKASTRHCPSSELVLVSKILLEDERQQVTADRAMALHNPEQFIEIYGRSRLKKESAEEKSPAGSNAAIDSRRHLCSESSQIVDDTEVKLEDNAHEGAVTLSPIEKCTPTLDVDHDVEAKPKVKVKDERSSAAGIAGGNRIGISPVLLPNEGGYRRSSTPVSEGGGVGVPKQSKCAIFSETIKSEQIADASFDGDPPSHGAPRNAIGHNATAIRTNKRVGEDLRHLSPPPIKIRIAKPKFGQEHCGTSGSAPIASIHHEDSRPPASNDSTVNSWPRATAFEPRTARPATQEEALLHGDGGESDSSDRIDDDDGGGPEEGSSEIEVDDDGDDGQAESLRRAAAAASVSLTPAAFADGYGWSSASSASPCGQSGRRRPKQPNGDVAGSLQAPAVVEREPLPADFETGATRLSHASYDDGDRYRLADASDTFSHCEPCGGDDAGYAYEPLTYAGEDGDDALRLNEVPGAVVEGPVDEAEDISEALAVGADTYGSTAPTDMYQSVAFDDGACDDELKNALESIK